MNLYIKLPLMALMLSAALIAGLYSNSASAQNEVCVYDKKDYKGDEFCTARSIPNLADEDWNDDIASVEIRGNVEVILYENADYKGKSTRLSGDTSRLRGSMENNVSSIKIVSAGGDGGDAADGGDALSSMYPASQGWQLQQFCSCKTGKRCYVRGTEVGQCVLACPSGCKN